MQAGLETTRLTCEWALTGVRIKNTSCVSSGTSGIATYRIWHHKAGDNQQVNSLMFALRGNASTKEIGILLTVGTLIRMGSV